MSDYKPEEIKAFFSEYESLKLNEKSTKERLDTLKVILVDFVPEDKELQGEYGIFIRKPGKTTWTYSDATMIKIDELEKIKTDEERTGAATAKRGKDFIEFRASKKNLSE